MEEIRRIMGENWFRVAVVAFGCLWLWHSLFGSVAELGQSRNISAQAENAAAREEAIRIGAVEEAKIKEATAREALRRQKAEADESVARACNRSHEAVNGKYVPLRCRSVQWYRQGWHADRSHG